MTAARMTGRRARCYHAACACGAVRFRVAVDAASGVRCICPRCRGLGLTIAHAPSDAFTLLTGAEALTESLRDAARPGHFFCGTCGEACFGFPQVARGGPVVAVSVACLRRGDPDAVVPASSTGRDVGA